VDYLAVGLLGTAQSCALEMVDERRHDCTAFVALDGEKVFWKIDYYDCTLRHGITRCLADLVADCVVDCVTCRVVRCAVLLCLRYGGLRRPMRQQAQRQLPYLPVSMPSNFVQASHVGHALALPDPSPRSSPYDAAYDAARISSHDITSATTLAAEMDEV